MKRFIALILILCISFLLCAAGNQNPTDTTLSISNAEELLAFAERVNKGEDFSTTLVVLTADIVVNENVIDDATGEVLEGDFTPWVPIGMGFPFNGTFDGNYHTVSGLYCKDDSINKIGFFGTLKSATVMNLNIDDGYLSNIRGDGYVGGFASRIDHSILYNCHNFGVVCETEYEHVRIGGITGSMSHSSLSNCSNYAPVSGIQNVGGLVGSYQHTENIFNCANFGSVNGTKNIGGIIGLGYDYVYLENCINAGEILCQEGGLLCGSDRVSIMDCYALQNDEINANLNFTTSRFEKPPTNIFHDETAILPSGERLVDVLNAWVEEKSLSSGTLSFMEWKQDDSFPYLSKKEAPSAPVLIMTPNTFADVTTYNWFYDEVKYVYDRGLMNGTSDILFEPSAKTTRAMLVTILYRNEGEPAVGTAEFTDVPAGKWYTNAVAWAAENGIVEGYPDNTFKPNNPITRQEVATIMYRYSQHQGRDVSAEGDLNAFADADRVTWSKTYMTWAVGAGIINGIDGKLEPTENALRSQVATMLMRYCEAEQ